MNEVSEDKSMHCLAEKRQYNFPYFYFNLKEAIFTVLIFTINLYINTCFNVFFQLHSASALKLLFQQYNGKKSVCCKVILGVSSLFLALLQGNSVTFAVYFLLFVSTLKSGP